MSPFCLILGYFLNIWMIFFLQRVHLLFKCSSLHRTRCVHTLLTDGYVYAFCQSKFLENAEKIAMSLLTLDLNVVNGRADQFDCAN